MEYLHSKFGKSRIVLYEGNSLDTVPNTFMENKPTLFHIDGCHLYDVAVKDMENCYNLAENNDVIILDDTNIYYLDKLLSIFSSYNLYYVLSLLHLYYIVSHQFQIYLEL